jgi:heme-degrading monooxygenase HmoA
MEATMILATAKISEDFDQFWNTFTTKGAEARKRHGSKGAHVYRDPNDAQRIWGVFDWSEDEFQEYISSDEAQEVFKRGGLQGLPQAAQSVGEVDS